MVFSSSIFLLYFLPSFAHLSLGRRKLKELVHFIGKLILFYKFGVRKIHFLFILCF